MFVFYDTETTGLNQDFSQILQIALVFTDDNLNILASKKLDCRSSPWVVPAPGALLTTGFSPDDMKFNKKSHYDMMRGVNNWLHGQHWPLTFVGYNSIGYDEPVLAQNFHQNLMDPHLTTSKNVSNPQSNGCADVMMIVKAVAAYMPGAIKLDIMNDYGKPSLSLLNVAKQNGVILSDHDAHDAMNDIKATVGLAKFLHKTAPQIWEQMMKLSTAAGMEAFMSSNPVFTYTNGRTKPAAMTSLSEGPASATTPLLYDLSFDPAPYLAMTTEQLKNVFFTRGVPNPFWSVRKNNQPILMPLDLSASVLPAGYDEKLYAARAKKIHADKDFLARITRAAALAEYKRTETLPEMMIDKKALPLLQARLDIWMKEFHTLPTWAECVTLIDNFSTRFKDDLARDPSLSRYPAFAERIVYEHAPRELGPERIAAMKKFIASRVLDPDLKAPYMTVFRARQELQQIEQERASGKKKKWAEVTDSQIRALKLYYTAIEKEYLAFAPPPPVNDNAQPPDVKKSSNGPVPPKA